MNEETRYGNDLFEQLNDLPLPGEDQAWQEMKQLLDEDKERKLVPPYIKIGAGVLVVAVLCFLLWVFFIPHQQKPADNDYKNTHDAEAGQTPAGNQSPGNKNDWREDSLPSADRRVDSTASSTRMAGDSINNSRANNKQPNSQLPNSSKDVAKSGVSKPDKITARGRGKNAGTEGKAAADENNNRLAKNNAEKAGKRSSGSKNIPSKQTTATEGREQPSNERVLPADSSAPGKTNEITSLQQPQLNDKPGTVAPPVKDNLLQQEPNNGLTQSDSANALLGQKPAKSGIVSSPKKDSAIARTEAVNLPANHQAHVEIGLVEQQAMRTGCNCVVSDGNIYNNTPQAKDYIPALYIRWYPAAKWFIQGELKLNAPEYVDESMYKMTIQNAPLNYITTSYFLKQARYNQIPLSINYVVWPGWSLGTGIMLNHFTGGVTQQDVKKKLYGSATDSLISSQIFTGTTDSIFSPLAKNSFQAFMQSEYKWKIFSVGARFAFGLQPYIKYNDPLSGKPVRKENQNLDVFIRIQLWNSLNRKAKKPAGSR